MRAGAQADMPVPWRVRMLGCLQVTRHGAQAAFRTRKTASLLAQLVFHRGKPISKALLAEGLWPDADVERGRHSLRMAVSALRAALQAPDWDSSEHLLSDHSSLTASEPGFDTDVARLQECLVRASQAGRDSLRLAALSESVELYGGSLLQDFSDEWILPQALELEEQYSGAVAELVMLNAKAGEFTEAVLLARKALALYPNREDLHVAVMRAYSLSGEPAAAIRQYEELERMLDDLWGEAPGAEAQTVLEELPQGRASGRAIVSAPAIQSDSLQTSAPFFGREDELEHLVNLLDPNEKGPRLVTLVGLGGTGKTRLAMRAAQAWAERFGCPAQFVALVDAEDEARLSEAVAASVDEQVGKGDDAISAASRAIGAQEMLLVLDNLEQIVGPSALAIQRLLVGCPRLRILATSRVPLDSEGERLVSVPPLALPKDYRDLAALRSNPSVLLLVDSAQAVRPGFGVTAANAQSVHLLCQKLEGIPLALQLAAAKLAMMSPAQVIASIGRRVELASSRSSLPERHRSLETVIDWSLNQLGPEERDAFARLSVCGRGFNYELAQLILGGGPRAEKALDRLSRCCLIGWREIDGELRFEMLETLREVGCRLLEADSEVLRECGVRQFEYACRLGLEWDSAKTESERAGWVARMELEAGNVLAALETGARGWIEPNRAWAAAQPLRHLIERRGRPQIWLAPLDALLAATEARLSPEAAYHAHSLLSAAYYGIRDIPRTHDHARKAIEHADKVGEAALRVEARADIVSAAITLGAFDEAQQALEEAAELMDAAANPSSAANCLLNLGWVIFDRGREEASEPHFREAVALAERSGDVSPMGSSYTGLACAIGHFRYEEAQPFFDKSHAVWSDNSRPGFVAHNLYYRGLIDYRHGHLERASALLAQALELFVCNGIALGTTILTIAGNVLARSGRHAEACLFWGRAASARQRQGMTMMPTLQRDYDREFPQAEAALGLGRLRQEMDRGTGLSDQELAVLFLPLAPREERLAGPLR